MWRYSRIFGVLAVGCVAVSGCTSQSDKPDASESIGQAGLRLVTTGISADVTISPWGDNVGFSGQVVITNTGGQPTSTWQVDVQLTNATITGGPWNAQGSSSGSVVTLKPETYNSVIDPGGTVTVSFNGAWSAEPHTNPTVIAVRRDGTTTGSGGAAGVGGSTSVGAAGATTSTATVRTASLQLPAGAALSSVALGATNKLTIADGVVVEAQLPGADADIASTGAEETNIGSVARIVGDVWSRGPVKLRSSGAVTKDINTQSTYTCENTCDVQGTTHQGTTLEPAQTYSWSVAFPTPSGSKMIDHKTEAILPGSYSQVAIQPDSTAVLSSGTYYFERFIAESRSVLSVDATDGPVILYVRDGFTYRGSISGAGASEIFVGYFGTETGNIDAPIKATVVAPNAQLRVGPIDGTGQEGSFFGREILAEARNPIHFVPFGHWDSILPPKLTLECLVRSGSDYGAGVFSYENVLDTPVTIPEGPNNNISASTRRAQGPLEVFAPGVHKNVYWLPFYGPSIQWNLSGTTITVDNSTPRCPLSKYRLEEDPNPRKEPLPPLPDDRVALLAASPGSLPFVTPSSAVQTPYVLPAGSTSIGTAIGSAAGTVSSDPSPMRQITMQFYNLTPGDECVLGEYNVSVEASVNGASQAMMLWDGDWLALAQGVPLGGTMTFDVPFEATAADVSIDIWDRHNSPCPDYHLFSYAQRHDMLSAPRQTLYLGCWPENDGWGLCANIESSFRPRICAQWPVQYLDSGYGEDKLPDTAVHMVPASFARVHLNITGGQEPFTPWPDNSYVVLDENGCLPAAYAPTKAQLTSAGSDFSVALDWMGALSLPLPMNNNLNELTVMLERTAAGDPWTACGCTGDAFVKPFDPNIPVCPGNQCKYGTQSQTPMVPAISRGSTDSAGPVDSQGRMMFMLGTLPWEPGTPTPYSSMAGVVSQIFKQHASGKGEMGLLPGLIHIWPESPTSFVANSPYELNRGTTQERFIEARPRWFETLANGDRKEHEPDSNRKFVMTHEFGHAVQDMSAGNTGNGNYDLVLQNRTSTAMVKSEDNPALAPECRCAHVGSEFSPMHCINSMEVVGSASGEGFGHFYAARLWNDSVEPNCYIPYAKWALLPTCPTKPDGSAVPCLRVGAPDNGNPDPDQNAYTLIDKLYSDPVDRNYLRTKLADWQFVKGPSLINCGDASRWRNKHCTEDPTTSPIIVDSSGPALAELGNEMDWMQFMWALTRDVNSWKIQQFFTLQQAACGGRFCRAQDDHSLHAWKLYEAARLNPPATLLPGATNGISNSQWLRLASEGYIHGVSLDLSLK